MLHILALLLSLIVTRGGLPASDIPKTKTVWISSEDHGDKPGVEFRVAYRSDGKLNLEMWLFDADEKGKIKERVRFPINVLESDAKSILFEYPGGDKKKHRSKIVFAKSPRDNEEPAVRIDEEEHQETKLVFRKSRPEK